MKRFFPWHFISENIMENAKLEWENFHGNEIRSQETGKSYKTLFPVNKLEDNLPG